MSYKGEIPTQTLEICLNNDRLGDTVCHGRFAVFQLGEVAKLRALSAVILRRIDQFRVPPAAA